MKNIPWFLPLPLLFLPVALLPGAGTGLFVAMVLTGMASAFVLLQYGRKCSRQERTPEAYWNHVKSGWQSLIVQVKNNSRYRDLFIAFTITELLLLSLIPLIGIPNLIIAAHYVLIAPALESSTQKPVS